MSIPRAHHYCPQFYLENFSQNSILYVHDTEKLETRKSKPKEEAHQRDFYKIETKDGTDPFYLEKEFGKIEAKARSAIQHIISELKLPQEDLLCELLNFVGILAVRTPKFRENIHNIYEDFVKKVMALTVFNKAYYDRIVAEVLKNDPNLPRDVTHEQMTDFIKNDKYIIERHQNDHILTMLNAAKTITDSLLLRNWRLVHSPDTEFISSDSPVSLWWTHIDTIRSPGFGLAGTTVSVPIAKNITICGTFEAVEKAEAEHVDETVTAKFNTLTLSRMRRFSYSTQNDFCWYQEKLCNVSDLFIAFDKSQDKKV